jgi:4'-phosphopantetheinyl transferase
MVDWLVQSAADQPQIAAGLAPDGLLSAPEMVVLSGLHVQKRRRDWLLGRWTAKQLLRASAANGAARQYPNEALAILAAADGAPEWWVDKGTGFLRGGTAVSISHAHGVAFCACAGPGVAALGADIEAIAPRPRGFAAQYFSAAEAAALRRAQPAEKAWLATAIWSGKEAALKAARQGLRLDTRLIECTFASGAADKTAWHPFSIAWLGPPSLLFTTPLMGWWRRWENFVLTLAVAGEQPAAVAGPRYCEGL